MENKIVDLLAYCSDIDFGGISISNEEKDFYNQLNNEIILLCKSLPQSIQTDALLFLMEYLNASFEEELIFFRKYYKPAWSIIYWLIQPTPDDKVIEKKDIKNAITGHAMAMFLHAFDDHLNDNELPATHQTLLLRSQSWMRMNKSMYILADSVDGGHDIVRSFIDDYYYSICSSKEIKTIDNYCDIFRKQMATWLIVPVLLAKKINTDKKFTDAVQTAYGSFGIAWRLLDDIKDIEEDMRKGSHSSLYICLPENIKDCWDKISGVQLRERYNNTNTIFNYILENNVVEIVKERICMELELAASITNSCDMRNLADEFCCLLRPLKSR